MQNTIVKVVTNLHKYQADAVYSDVRFIALVAGKQGG